jgi:hypothetical protein
MPPHKRKRRSTAAAATSSAATPTSSDEDGSATAATSDGAMMQVKSEIGITPAVFLEDVRMLKRCLPSVLPGGFESDETRQHFASGVGDVHPTMDEKDAQDYKDKVVRVYGMCSFRVCPVSRASWLLSPVSCLLSPVSCLLSPVSCLVCRVF